MVLTTRFTDYNKNFNHFMNPLINSAEFSSLDRDTPNSIFLTNLNDFANWARLSSLWPLLYGTSCCFIEFASLIGSRFDFDRYGLVPRSSPRQADLIVTAGTITMKMAPSLVRLYEQMPEPKYVIAMGACTITGGMFSTDSYSTVRGVDKLIPVDIYLPGCPPKPEAIIDAITKLRKKVAQEIYRDPFESKKKDRVFTLKHQFSIITSIHIRQYNQQLSNQFSKTFLDIPSKTASDESKISVESNNEGLLLRNEEVDIFLGK
uniref:NADH-quinone oxidoreductase subunit B n=1 Tax=Mankyua chejuensis TaxID=996148 RepID=H8Y620_9MONI|nr:NADH-plastoquinone oxidoreductase subunit K [Mankyua chejuensis]ADZ47988.1 NADH-plastoquinone oxidoreductase subunit K [Mankyua chejuensis]AJJ48618.1 NADH dehydrogenase subunit K [Mankyua chejuensis]